MIDWIKDYVNVLTVLVAVIGLVIAVWRSYIAHRQAKTAARQAETAAEDHDLRRFSWAIEQLGGEDLAGLLGGIDALETIAQKSPEDYHWRVMEVLCSFVRENTRGRSKDIPKDINKDEAYRLSRLPAEIQAILTVLGRRDIDAETQGQHLDLRQANLSFQAELHYAKLKGAYLHETDFQQSVFSWADLRGAICFNANFCAATFSEADLTGAKLGNADLRCALFAGTDLRGADLGRAKLGVADLSRAKNLTQDQVDSAYGDEHTKLPARIKRPDHWVNKTTDEDPVGNGAREAKEKGERRGGQAEERKLDRDNAAGRNKLGNAGFYPHDNEVFQRAFRPDDEKVLAGDDKIQALGLEVTAPRPVRVMNGKLVKLIIHFHIENSGIQESSMEIRLVTWAPLHKDPRPELVPNSKLLERIELDREGIDPLAMKLISLSESVGDLGPYDNKEGSLHIPFAEPVPDYGEKDLGEYVGALFLISAAGTRSYELRFVPRVFEPSLRELVKEVGELDLQLLDADGPPRVAWSLKGLDRSDF